MASSCFSIFVCMLLLNAQEASTLTLQDFFPFGPDHNDTELPQEDDFVQSITLPIELPFFGKVYTTVGISTNGLLSLNSTVTDFTPRVFPTDGVLIAPFWADVDIRGIGSIYYRITSNKTLLNRFSMDITSSFTGQVIFSPQILFIATWSEVGYFSMHTDKNNTFQCVLATNGEASFVVFLYKEGGIQWTTGDFNNGMNGLGGNPATVGFNAGDMISFELVTGSNTDAVINISSTTNVGVPGKWAFKVNNATLTAPDPCLSNPCDQNADCLQIGLSSDFMCTCVAPYSGNGTLCTIPDPCLSQPCDSNALCERNGVLNENFTCTCLSPFVGDGYVCTIPDPCQASPCNENANCTREGSLSENFTCECQPPFTVGNGFHCSIPDPCLSQPCDINAVCERESSLNTNFICTCSAPFTVGDGFNCSIPDPCLNAPCGPNADCERQGPLTNAFTCTCRPPFTMEDSLLGCIIPDPCQSAPCHSNATCERESILSEDLTCACILGFTGDGYSCTPLEDVGNGDNSLSVFQRHKTPIAISLSLLGLIVLILLVGIVYGYIFVSRTMYKRIRLDSQTEV